MNIYGTLQAKNNIDGGINVASIGGGGTSDFDVKIIPYAERISANEESIEDINTAIENHTEQIARLRDDVNYLEEEVEGHTQNITNLNISVNNINQTVAQQSIEINAKTPKTDVPFKFGIDNNGNYGYIKEGADTVTPFKSNNIVALLEVNYPYGFKCVLQKGATILEAPINESNYIFEIPSFGDWVLSIEKGALYNEKTISITERVENISIETALVPQMTSNTTPSGIVSAQSTESGSVLPFKAFDRNTSTRWSPSAYQVAWIQYFFDKDVVVSKISVNNTQYGTNGWKLKVQGSNDGITFTDLTEEFTPVNPNANAYWEYSFNNTTPYKYYRLAQTTQSQTALTISELQFYGYEV